MSSPGQGQGMAFMFDFSAIPDGSFVVFRTWDPDNLLRALGAAAPMLEERKIQGIIIRPDVDLQTLSPDELKELGLGRIN